MTTIALVGTHRRGDDQGDLAPRGSAAGAG